MLKENIIKKFTQVFASIPQDQQNALATELAKMIPATPDADVDWGVSWGYYIDKAEVNVGISLKICPAIHSEKEKTLTDLLADVVSRARENQLSDLDEALDIVLNDINFVKKMTHTPVLALTENTSAIRLRLWGTPSEKAKMNEQHQKESLKSSKEIYYV
ncbi:MAG: hypothetical protein MUE81_23985 [Thermoflexibacter sp.]|jgi:hypothetical protein|nr:hypothetical protein [Thermoflexibacter sp.]